MTDPIDTSARAFGVIQETKDNVMTLTWDDVLQNAVLLVNSTVDDFEKDLAKATGHLLAEVINPFKILGIFGKGNRVTKGVNKIKNGTKQVPEDWAKMSGSLRTASKEKGNFNIGSATREQADIMGKAWVGDNFKTSTNNKAIISSDGMRQYPPPTYKPHLEKTQANFQKKLEGCPTKQWQSNGHYRYCGLKNMRAQLKGFFCEDIDNLRVYKPPSPENFCISIQLLIGPQGAEGEESFDIQVCTPQWFLSNYNKNDIIILRHTMIVFEYNFDLIIKRLEHEVALCTGNNWQEIAFKLSRLGHWEFEDYENDA